MYHATWLKTKVFGQCSYRKFSGVCGWRAYQDQGRYAEAEPLHQQALAITERGLGPDHPDVARSLHNLARLYRVQGRYAEAEPLLQQALAITERGLGPDHPDTAAVREDYAILLRHRSREVAPSQSLGRRIRAWLSRK